MGLVLKGCQVKQIKVQSRNDLVVSVVDSRLVTGLVEEGVLRSNKGELEFFRFESLLLVHEYVTRDCFAALESVRVV